MNWKNTTESGVFMKTAILIEKTAKRWKRLELLALGLLFPTLFAGLGLMYVSFAAAIAAWILAGLCFAGFCAVKIMAWYCHG